MLKRTQVIEGLMILSITLGSVTGCAAPATPSAVPTAVPSATQPPAPTEASSVPTPPPGWETHAASTDLGQCGYAIDHPSDIDVTSQGIYSWTLGRTTTEPSGPVPSFIYISVIPDGFQSSEPGAIYNYDPAETQTLLNLQVGERRALREDPNSAPWFTYTRLPDTTLGAQAAQTYENIQPWEFPAGTKEIRYYLKGNGCTYLVGGYLATVGSGQPGAIDQELFDQIIASFRLAR